MKRTLSAIVLTVGVTLGAAACFSKPGFTGGGGDGDGGVDAPGDASPVCTPGVVPPLVPVPKEFAKLSAGPYHTCGVDTLGQMWCWGYNGEEALGRSAQGLPETGAAQQVGSGTGWSDIAVGAEHSCGVQNGMVKCWGGNGHGQVTFPSSGSPLGETSVPLAGNPTIARVFAGPTATCALTDTGAAYCWGRLELAAASPAVVAPSPLTVTGLAWADIAIAGDHACAVATTGVVYCWGKNGRQQLGEAGIDRTFSAPVVKPGSGYTRIAAAEGATCAIRSQALVCWGATDHGHLGDPESLATEYAEREVDTTRAWADVALGEQHACGRTITGQVVCYGTGLEGALGLGDDQNSWNFATNVPLATASTITAGRSHSCAVTAGGAASCWGSNTYGQAGTGLVSRKIDPSRVRLPVGSCERVRTIEAGEYHTCALVGVDMMPGHVYCWGGGQVKQVDATSSVVAVDPVQVTGSDGGEALFTQVAVGAAHTCALTPDGRIECWGDDNAGELGTPDSDNPGRTVVLAPTVPGGGPGTWTYVAAGATTSCGIAAGALYCWGSIPGESPRTEDSPTAVGAPPIVGWAWEAVEIGSTAAGARFVIGVMRDGAGKRHVVGFGEYCSIGSPGGVMSGTTDASMAVEVLDSAGFDAVVVTAADNGGGHACAATSVGGVDTLRCWGSNDIGQASIQTRGACAPPTVAAGTWRMPVAGTRTVAAASGHTIAINGNGALAAWGENYSYQSGRAPDGPPAPFVFTPVGVRYVSLTTGRSQTCAIDDTRTAAWCWGRNDYAQLGDGARDYFAPHPAGVTLP